MKIDPDITATELIEAWANGKRSWVIEKLSNDHPGLTALVITQGSLDGTLKLDDVNSITNMLIDDRQELAMKEVLHEVQT